MKNINSTVYGKMIIQANEAKELGFEKLAENVLSAMPPHPREDEEKIIYSSQELQNNLHQKLWKIAMDFICYHDLESVDVQKVEDTIVHLAGIIYNNLELALESDKIGPLEPKLPGESE